MSKKKTSKASAELKAEIKKMEEEKRKQIAELIPKDKKVSFDSLYHQRSHKIPKLHVKEIILADFTARGLSKQETIEEYDKALKQYGVSI